MNEMISQNKPLMRIKHLSKTFELSGLKSKKVQALRDISFNLYEGKALALVGESGSGKSTVARILTKMHEPSFGEIRYQEKDILAQMDQTQLFDYRKNVQMVFQDPFSSLNPIHTIYHHIARPLLRHSAVKDKSKLKQKVGEILRLVELDPEVHMHKHPHELSGGQRQRVALARTLAIGAKVILADEPTSMLDVSIRKDILNLLKKLKDEQHIAFLYITHDIATAKFFAENMAVLYQGQIVEWGETHKILNNPAHPYTKLLLAALPNPANRIGAEDHDQFKLLQMADQIRDFSAQKSTKKREVEKGHFLLDQGLFKGGRNG